MWFLFLRNSYLSVVLLIIFYCFFYAIRSSFFKFASFIFKEGGNFIGKIYSPCGYTGERKNCWWFFNHDSAVLDYWRYWVWHAAFCSLFYGDETYAHFSLRFYHRFTVCNAICLHYQRWIAII